MQLFDAETVHKLLPYEALIPALGKMHENEIPSGNSVHMKDPSGADNMFVTLPGWLSDQLIVVKMVGVFPDNRAQKPPLGSVLGAVAAFDAKTGAPVLVADGEAMTYRKTAAISGLGAAQLALPNPRNLLIVVRWACPACGDGTYCGTAFNSEGPYLTYGEKCECISHKTE